MQGTMSPSLTPRASLLNQVLREDLNQTNGMLLPSGELHRGAILRYDYTHTRCHSEVRLGFWQASRGRHALVAATSSNQVVP